MLTHSSSATLQCNVTFPSAVDVLVDARVCDVEVNLSRMVQIILIQSAGCELPDSKLADGVSAAWGFPQCQDGSS